MIPETQATTLPTTIGGVAIDVVTAAPQVITVNADGGAPQVKSIWLDGFLPADAALVAAWRRDAATRFPAHIWLDGTLWACDVVVVGLEWGTRPGLVRIQAQSAGPLARAEQRKQSASREQGASHAS